MFIVSRNDGQAKKNNFLSKIEEILDFEVKKYLRLFDKTNKGYKEKDCVANAWGEVAKQIEFIQNGIVLVA